MTEWSDADKAQWILENGKPDIKWIYERNGSLVYKRPIVDTQCPPWINKERELVFTLSEKIEKQQRDDAKHAQKWLQQMSKTASQKLSGFVAWSLKHIN